MKNEIEILREKTNKVLEVINSGASASEVTTYASCVFSGYITKEIWVDQYHVSFFLQKTLEALLVNVKTTKKMAEYLREFDNVLKSIDERTKNAAI